MFLLVLPVSTMSWQLRCSCRGVNRRHRHMSHCQKFRARGLNPWVLQPLADSKAMSPGSPSDVTMVSHRQPGLPLTLT